MQVAGDQIAAAAAEPAQPELHTEVAEDCVHGGLSVFLYHTHVLGWLGKLLLPARWNEGVSLQHCKAYLFDDDVLISGANLSDTCASALALSSPPASVCHAHSIAASDISLTVMTGIFYFATLPALRITWRTCSLRRMGFLRCVMRSHRRWRQTPWPR